MSGSVCMHISAKNRALRAQCVKRYNLSDPGVHHTFALTLASATVSTPPPPLPSSLQQLHLPHQQPFFRDRGPLTASTSAFARGGLYWCAQRSPQTPSAPAPPHRPYSH